MERKRLSRYVGGILLVVICLVVGLKVAKDVYSRKVNREISRELMKSEQLNRYLGKWAADENGRQEYLTITKHGEDQLAITNSSETGSEEEAYKVTIASIEKDQLTCLSLNEYTRYFFYLRSENQLTYIFGINAAKHPNVEALSAPTDYIRVND